MKAGFKQTEVGLIPEDWEVQRLGDLFDISSSKRVFQSEWRSSGVPFYRARELAVLGEKGRVDNELFITKSMYEAYRNSYGVPQIGDLLVTGVGTLGKVYVVPDSHEFYFKDGNIIWFKIRGSINSAFLDQLFQTKVVTHQIEDSAGGTTVGTYTISGAKKTTIPYPPPPEQESIAEALGDADALIESLERLIAKKRDVKQGAMQELLTARRRLPGFTEKWMPTRFGQLGHCIRGVGYNPDADLSPHDTPSTIRLLRANNVQRASIVFTDLQFVDQSRVSNDQCLQLKDVLICMANGSKDLVGKAGQFVSGQGYDYTFGAFMGCFRPDMNAADPDFCFFMFQSEAYRKHIAILLAGTSINNLSPGSIENFEMSIPTNKLEQTAIAAVLSDMDAEIAALEEKLGKARAIKQGMMQELLTGRIRLV